MNPFKSAAREHVQAVHGPGCMCILHQHERAVAARKGQTVPPKSEVKAESLAQTSAAVTQILADPALKSKKVAADSSVIIPADSVINPPGARKRGRPVKSNDTTHQQGRERARLYRERKAAAQTSKVGS